MIIGYILWGLSIYLCYRIAWKKGYSQRWAAFFGAIGGFISVIVYACLENKKQKKEENI